MNQKLPPSPLLVHRIERPHGYHMLKHFIVYAANGDDTIETIVELWAYDLAGAKQRARQLFPDAAELYVMP